MLFVPQLQSPDARHSRRAQAFRHASIHHDLDAVAGFHLGVGIEPIEDAKPLDLMIDASHPMRQRFHGVTGLNVNDLDAQRSCGLNLF